MKEKKKARHAPKLSDEKIEELLQKDIKIDTETKSNLDLHRVEVLVGIGGLALAAVALYLNYKSNKSAPSDLSRIGPSEQTLPQSKTC